MALLKRMLTWRRDAAWPPVWMWGTWTVWLLVLLWPYRNAVPYVPGAHFSDMATAHLPQILFWKRAISLWHTWPLWAPTYNGGYPFYANPLSGLWYAPGWLGMVLPLPWGVGVTVGLHALGSAAGMYVFLRGQGRSQAAAWGGAMAWLGFSKLWAHWGAGHLSLLYAVAWTPWLLVVSDSRSRWWRPATLLALIFLADPRWAAYAGILWLAWTACRFWQEKNQWSRKAVGALTQTIAWEIGLALALAAPLLIPLLHYTALSTRSAMQPDDVFILSLPWAGLLGAWAPAGHQPEWAFYAGAAVFLLAVLAWRHRQARFWGWMALAALIWALGSALPLTWLGRVPGINLLRVPPRGVFLWGLALAAAFAQGMDIWQTHSPTSRSRWFWAVLASLAASMAFALEMATHHAPRAFFFAAMWLLAAAGVLWPRRSSWQQYAWPMLLAVDLFVAARGWSEPRPWQSVMSPPAVLAELPSQTGAFRLYSPSYSIPQHVAAARGWELANGVDPLVLAAYAEFLAEASGVALHGYSVVLPPLEGDNLQANRMATPSAERLGLLNVRFVVAAFPINAAGLTLAAQSEDLWLYENMLARPRAWVESAGMWHPAADVSWTPNSVTIHAAGPGNLVLSEVAYPGWTVAIDGAPAEAATAYGVLRAARLPAGQHEIVWVFRPWDLLAGLMLALLAWLAVWRGRRPGLFAAEVCP